MTFVGFKGYASFYSVCKHLVLAVSYFQIYAGYLTNLINDLLYIFGQVKNI